MIKKRSLILIFFFSLTVSFSFFNIGSSQESLQSEERKREPLSKWSKQWLEEVVPYIITDAEKNLFVNLPTEEERGRFIENFWKKRDPSPITPENEFKLEYYKRIALANKFFGTSGIEGWRTDRGKIYILLGPPNEIQRDMSPSGTPFSAFHGPKEVWNYWGLSNPRLPYNLEFVFVDKFGTGNYVLEQSLKLGEAGSTSFDINSMHYQFNYIETLAEATKNPFEGLNKLKGIIITQVTYDLIPIEYKLFYLKGPGKRMHIPVVIDIPYSSFTQKKIENEYYFSLTLLINVSNSLGQIIFERSKDVNFKRTSAEIDSLKDKTFRIQTSLSLEPEAYKIHLLVLDNFSGKIGTLYQEFSIPKFSSEELSMSDIILSSRKKAEKREASSIEDKMFTEISHSFRSDEELNIYFEAYNLSLNPTTGMNDFRVEYFFLQNQELLAHVSYPTTEPSAEKDCRVQTSFRLKNFKPGEYILRVKVADSNSGRTEIKEVQFIITQ